MATYIIENMGDFEDMLEYYKCNEHSFGPIAFDLETDSLEETKALVWGIGLAFNEEDAFYIPIRNNKRERMWTEHAENLFADTINDMISSKGVIGHNIIYDCLVWMYNYGYDFSNKIHADTILMKHCLDEEPPFGLKEIAVNILGPWADKAQTDMIANIKANGGSATKTNMEMWKCDTSILGEYCCWDVLLTYKLYNVFSKRLKDEGLEKLFYDDEVMPLYREVTIPMKQNGLNIDVAYFEKLKGDITADIDALENQVLTDITPLIEEFCQSLLDKECPVKKTGNYPKVLGGLFGLTLDSLAKKIVQHIVPDNEEQNVFLNWLVRNGSDAALREHGHLVNAQLQMFFNKYTDRNHVFNLRSRDHLKHLFFDVLQLEPLSKTETGLPQVDDAFLESIKSGYQWVSVLQDLNKLEKIKGTYIEGILDRQLDGIIYASMLQFGTTSGRYASRNPNLQNLPRPKEEDSGLSEMVLKYTNAIRAGFIAPAEYKFIDCDYSALEPRCFAHMSGDKNLQQIFHSGEDMYSAIAKRVFNLPDVSTFKKDENFLGKLHPEKRQIIKALALAVTYGAEAFRIGSLLGVGREEAQKLIDDYLNAYPGLKDYIKTCHYEANTKGAVRTIFGRVRHLKEVRETFLQYGKAILDSRWARSQDLGDERRIYKSKLNNSTNFRIQGLAAHIVNRAMIKIAREFKSKNIDGWVTMTVHDQVICSVRESQIEPAINIVRDAMQNIVKLSVPLIAEPQAAYNLRDSH